MRVVTLTTQYMESHSYLLTEEDHAVIIDPGDAGLLAACILQDKLVVDYGILTHEHCDHTAGCTDIQKEFNCKIIASRLCNENLNDPRKNLSRYYSGLVAVQNRLPQEAQKEMEAFTAHADLVFQNTLDIYWCGHRIACCETPGHSQGSICVLVDDKILFSGDSLMWGEKTNTRFKGGSEEQYREKTLPWLKGLPGDITVYAGHKELFVLKERLLYPIL